MNSKLKIQRNGDMISIEILTPDGGQISHSAYIPNHSSYTIEFPLYIVPDKEDMNLQRVEIVETKEIDSRWDKLGILI